jgi:prepilin-type processing-associated H-X9-DG protein
MPSFEPSGATKFWRVDARTGAVRQLESIPGYADLSVSSTQPLAVVYGKNEDGGYVRALSADGALGPVIALHQSDAMPLGWSLDGTTIYFFDFPKPLDPPLAPLDPAAPPSSPTMSDGKAQAPPRSYPAFSPATGALTAVSERPSVYRTSDPTTPFTVSTTEMKTATGPRGSSPESAPWSPTFHPLWLEQKGDPLFRRLSLAADADAFLVSPRNDAVAYQNAEGAFVVPLVAVPTAKLKQAREQAQISELLNDGKQIALAAIMAAQDNDGELPGAGSDMKAVLGPYLRNGEVFDGMGGGFQYTFGGGPMSAIEDPSGEHLGYFDGPGGRAVVFADGHVTWVPNP